jgi:hypothetical protein
MPLVFGFEGDGARSRNEPDRPPVPLDLIPGREPTRPEVPVAEGPDYSGLDLAAAALRQGNLIGSAADRLRNYPLSFTDDPTFDPAEHIEGFEEHWQRFVRANSLEETQFIKDKIRAEQTDRDVIQQAGLGGLASVLAAGVVDPWTLASMALPVAAPATLGTKAAVAAGTAAKLTRAQRVWGAVAANAALDTAGEVGMHSSQELRTISDSLLTIGAGTLLTGALGTIATRVPKSEFEQIVREMEGVLPNARTTADSAGAARVGGNLTLEDEGIATPAGRAIANTMGRISPLTRTLMSPVKGARRLIQELAHVPYSLEKNLKGVSNPDAIEDIVNANVRSRQTTMRRMMDAAFAQHKAAGGTLSHREFSAAVARELDGIPQPNVPQAAPVVQWARKTLNEDRERIRTLPGYEKFGEEQDANAYFPHAYDRERIISDLAGFKRMLFDHFKANPLIPREGAVERAKLIAERRQGVNDATINLEIAEREAKEAAQAYDTAKAQLEQARKTATGRGGAKDQAHRAKRAAQAKRREAARLKRRLDKLDKQLQDIDDAVPPRPEPAIEAELAAATAKRTEVKSSISGIKALGRKLAHGTRKLAADLRTAKARATRLEEEAARLAEAGDAKALKKAEIAAKARTKADDLQTRLAADRAQMDGLRGQLKAAQEQLEHVVDDIFDRRTELAVARSRDTKLDTLANRRGQALNRATDAVDELADAEELAKQLKQRAVTARKIVRALKRPTKEARKAKVKAEYTARKAVIPQRDDAEIMAAVDDAVRNILGENQVLTVENIHSSANALKERRLDVPAEKLDPWLVRDAETVLSRYARRIVPEIELRSRFGSSNLANDIQAVRDEFEALRAANPAKAKEIGEQATKTVEDILTVLNRVAGRSQSHSSRSFVRKLVRASRIARLYNYVRLLGSQTVSSLSDTGRLVMRHGLPQTMRATAKFLTDWNFARLSKADAQRMNTALEMMSDFRMQQMADLSEEMPISRQDKIIDAVGGAFSRLTLMSPWNTMLKVGASALEQDSVVRMLSKDTLSKADVAKLARAGIDSTTIGRVKAMIARHADDSDGLWRLRTDLWEDQDAALRMERHIMGVGDEIVLTRGTGDLPALMDNELVKTWLQFRTFALASVNRTLIPVAQGLSLGDAKTAQGVASMLSMGAITYYAKEKLAGREPDLSPGRMAAEAANWSGLLGFLPDLWDPIAGLHEDIPRFSRFMSRSISETLGGPTFGSGFNFAYGVLAKIADGELKQEDIHGIRRALPFQNLFYVSRLFNAIEGEVGEMLGAEKSNTMDFTDRLAQELPSKETK